VCVAGTPEARRTVVGLDIGARSAARVAAGRAPLRGALARLIMLSRWDAVASPSSIHGRSATIPSRRRASRTAPRSAARHLPHRHLTAFKDLRFGAILPEPCRRSSRSTAIGPHSHHGRQPARGATGPATALDRHRAT
jgi:hypothetical protein